MTQDGATETAQAVPDAVAKRGITEAEWRTLCNNLYPGAHPNSVLMVVDYCRVRRLDPMKKPCHIVPMRIKDAKTQEYAWRDVVMPGIYEYRTTAQRTGEYLGHSTPTYGKTIEWKGLSAPEWCDLTVYRWNDKAQQRAEFTVRTYFTEVVATKRDGKPNERWSKAPRQMLTKCCEAAALREGFPDELGGEPTFEEMTGQQALTNGEPKGPNRAWATFSEDEQQAISQVFRVGQISPGQQTMLLRKFSGDAEGLMTEVRAAVGTEEPQSPALVAGDVHWGEADRSDERTDAGPA